MTVGAGAADAIRRPRQVLPRVQSYVALDGRLHVANGLGRPEAGEVQNNGPGSTNTLSAQRQPD